jgi:hypothetical protein
MLEAADASPMTVAFTRFHPGDVPRGLDPVAWRLLAEADDA